jgi:hypothetical protein
MAGETSSVESLQHRNKLIVGCPKVGDTNYARATGINVSAADYTPANGVKMNALLLTAGSGNIALTLENGGKMTLPFTVDSGKCSIELLGCRIKTVEKTGTTFNGYIFPLF